MRSLLLVGILIGLALVAYLQVDSAQKSAEQYGTQSAQDLPRQVESEINAVTEQHMQKLRQSTD